MKKMLKKTLTLVLALIVLALPVLPVSAAAYEQNCFHENVRVEAGPTVKETCYAYIREYTKWCSLCGEQLASGTVETYKDTPTHSLAWRSVRCNPDVHTHTYEKYCTKCSDVLESLEALCYGNCVIPQSAGSDRLEVK